MTCPICPNGCQIHIDPQTGAISGNRCPRGKAFAEQEKTHPCRTLTTTLRVDGGEERLVNIRSDKAFGREHLAEAMEQLKKVRAQAPIRLGDVLAELSFDGETVRFLAGEDAAEAPER